MTDSLLSRAISTHLLTHAEIVELLSLPDPWSLYKAADQVRQQYVGDGVYLRGLIEFSSYCKNDCVYCGLRRSNTQAQRYRLSPEQMVEMARKAVGYGYKTVVLQSGEDLWFTTDTMCQIIREIKKLGLVITLSIGEKTHEE